MFAENHIIMIKGLLSNFMIQEVNVYSVNFFLSYPAWLRCMHYNEVTSF